MVSARWANLQVQLEAYSLIFQAHIGKDRKCRQGHVRSCSTQLFDVMEQAIFEQRVSLQLLLRDVCHPPHYSGRLACNNADNGRSFCMHRWIQVDDTIPPPPLLTQVKENVPSVFHHGVEGTGSIKKTFTLESPPRPYRTMHDRKMRNACRSNDICPRRKQRTQ